MAPLAFTALTTATSGSYATGAAIVATIVIAEVVCAVPMGRLFDRTGIVRGLRAMLALRGIAYLGLLAAAVAGLPAGALIAIAVVVGALGGGLLGGFRALLTEVVGEKLLPRAVAVNTMMVDLVIVGGPVLVGLLTALSTTAPVLLMAAASILAVPLVAAGRETVRATPVTPGNGLLRTLFCWICCAFAVGHLTSTVEVAVLPIAERLDGGANAAAVIVVVLSAASLLGGFLYLRINRPGNGRTAAALLAVLASGGAVVAFGASWPVVIVGTALTGVCIGPLITINSVLVEDALPTNRRAEGFGLINTAQGLGFGLGSLSLSVMPLRAGGLVAVASALLAAAVVFRYAPRSRPAEPAPAA
ncbi:MFS transporter [Actinoplanes sp. OR16]|nr:MFS transporter [Actinoplanes sp. OR16]